MHRTTSELVAALDHLRGAPSSAGSLELVVRRPRTGEREVLEEGVLDPDEGLVGDCWRTRGARHTPDGAADPDRQVTLINARLSRLVAIDPDRRALAGDQLHVDLDLSVANLPPGTRLAVGAAVVEVTEPPHTGCAKFRDRFGRDALRFVNSPDGRALRLRGLNAKVMTGGVVRPGDEVRIARA